MKAVIERYRKQSTGDYETDPYFISSTCEGLTPILNEVRNAILNKTERIIITTKYDKANDFEIKRALMIKTFG